MQPAPRHFVVFGVSGAGKSTVGRRLAEAFHYDFADADDFHSAESIEKMSAGIPLTSADREPWLKSVRDWMRQRAAEGKGTTVACSALKHAYRDQLRDVPGGVTFIHLDGSRDMIEARLARRSNHFMPVSLLGSQFDALEPLSPDEDGIVVDAGASVDSIVSSVRDALIPAG